MTKRNDIAEIKAEVLLNYLYPEMSSMWTARMEGTFYRNYNHDALTINVDEHDVTLARDGSSDLGVRQASERAAAGLHDPL